VVASIGVSAGGWHLESAGGGRRGQTSHDADFLLTRRGDGKTEGVAGALYDALLARRLILPKVSLRRHPG
jgi:hypothetical protein